MLEDGIHGRKADRFTLQWHLTNACELSCKHCYDRTLPSPLTLDDARRLVDEFVDFCRRREVRGNVCLTGGNPFLFPGFFEVVRHVEDRGLTCGILGNAAPRRLVEQLLEIRMPTYYQVSLEGLEEHNDDIRGSGVFRRVLEFLPMLRDLGIRGGVMVTLTKANMEQIIPLGELLRGKARSLTFSRLSQVGSGANLELPSTEDYGEFMVRYLAARRENPTLTLKDNLFNIFHHELGLKLFGGCTGKGCGAAFNTISVLPDGEALACRKFPSPIGNVLELGLDAVYDSPEAERYRRGCEACDGCAIRRVCGGCMAVVFGMGKDPFKERDPFCFM